MTILLAIGADEGWLETIRAAGEPAGAQLERCASVCDAVLRVSNGLQPVLVLADGASCTLRMYPALRALRALVHARVLVAFESLCEEVGRGLPCDAVIAKAHTCAAVARELRLQRD